LKRPEGQIDFESTFARSPLVEARAPGRVNLIGEHTDYNGGFVLPIATPQSTRVSLAPRSDRVVRVRSVDMEGEEASYSLGAEARRGHWIDYVQGVTAALRWAGVEVGGFDALVESDVPVGAGLSSSAAIEVATLRALREAFGLDLDDVKIALLAQRGENDLVGAPVGVMDPMACSLADTSSALFLDARSLAYELIPFPAAAGLCVIDSGITHDHTAGEYGLRRAECERAAELLGVPQLRDLCLSDLPRAAALPEPLGRRVRHVVSENDRVLKARDALRSGDLSALGSLFDASHRSMRDDYEVSTPEIDVLVEIAQSLPAVYGARLTGGGFGGCVVVLAARAEARAVAERASSEYAARTGRRGTALLPPPAP
jgi:galactokinase